MDLTQEERSSYNAAYEVYIGYVRGQGLQRSHGAAWVQELKRLSTVDTDAHRAWLARRQALKLLESCHGKFAALEALLEEYAGERMLVFTGSSEVAYTISRQYLVPAITRETEPVERKHILDAFRTGRYSVVVTTEELKEGVEVSEAKVQPVPIPEKDRITWVIIADDYLPVRPIQQYLTYLETVERSPNTFRA